MLYMCVWRDLVSIEFLTTWFISHTELYFTFMLFPITDLVYMNMLFIDTLIYVYYIASMYIINYIYDLYI